MLEKRINRKDFTMGVCIFLVLFICTLLHDIPFFSYVSLATFFVFMYTMLVRRPHFMITYFAFVFTSTGLIVGCAICEFSDAFMPEFSDWGRYAGSLPLLIILYVSFFMAIAFFDWARENRPKNNLQQIQKERYPIACHYIAVLCVIVMLVLFLRVVRHPAFLLGYSRTLYSKEFGNRAGIFGTLDANMYIMITFVLLDYLNGHKLTGKIGIALYFLYYLWTGHKFGVFLNFLIIVTLVCHNKFLEISKQKLTKIIYTVFSFVTLLLLALASLLAVNMWTKVVNAENMTNYFLMRTAAQGGLWWKTFYITDRTHIDEIDNEIKGILEHPAHPENYINYGMYKMMAMCINRKDKKALVDNAIKNGYVLTEAGCASSYYYLGATGGVIFFIFHAFVISLTFNALFSAIRRNKIFRIVVLVRIYAISRYTLFSIEYFSIYLNFLSIIGYVILIVGMWQDYMTKIRSRQAEDKTYLFSSGGFLSSLQQNHFCD